MRFARYEKPCERCGEMFPYKHPNARYCPDCRKIIEREYNTDYVRNKRGTDASDRTCPYCGVVIHASKGGRIVCSSEECQKKHKRAWKDEHKKKPVTKVCIICSAEYSTVRDEQVTCGKPECKRKHQRTLATAYQIAVQRAGMQVLKTYRECDKSDCSVCQMMVACEEIASYYEERKTNG